MASADVVPWSQDQTIPELWGLEGTCAAPPLQPPLPQQFPAAAAHTASRQVWISAQKETPPPLWAAVPGLCHPHSTQLFLTLTQNSLGSNLCPLPLVLALGTTKHSPAPSSSPPTLQISTSTAQTPLSLLSSTCTAPGLSACPQQEVLQAPTISSPSAGLSLPSLPASGEPHTGHSAAAVPTGAEQRAGAPPCPAGHALCSAPQGPIGLLGHQ